MSRTAGPRMMLAAVSALGAVLAVCAACTGSSRGEQAATPVIVTSEPDDYDDLMTRSFRGLPPGVPERLSPLHPRDDRRPEGALVDLFRTDASGRLFVLPSGSSSSCPVLADPEVRRIGHQEVAIRLRHPPAHLPDGVSRACTLDIALITSVVELPDGVDPAAELTVVVDDGPAVTLPPVTASRGSWGVVGGPDEVQDGVVDLEPDPGTPDAGLLLHGQGRGLPPGVPASAAPRHEPGLDVTVIEVYRIGGSPRLHVVTHGSGSCPPVIEMYDIRTGEDGHSSVWIRVRQYQHQDLHRLCTDDYSPTTTVLDLPAEVGESDSVSVAIDGILRMTLPAAPAGQAAWGQVVRRAQTHAASFPVEGRR